MSSLTLPSPFYHDRSQFVAQELKAVDAGGGCARLPDIQRYGAEMAGTREKAISYRHAHWGKKPKHGEHLEAILIKSYKKLTKAKSRVIERNGQSIKCGKPDILDDGGILLHYTAETPGEATSVVKKGTDDDEDVATEVLDPTEDYEFLDAEAFVLVVGDNVFICVSRFKEQAVRPILARTLEKAGFSEDSVQFELRAAANVDKVEIIHKEGVAEVDLRASMYEASHNHAVRKNSTAWLASEISTLILGMPNQEDPDEDNLKVSLTLRGDGRMKTGIVAGSRKLQRIAQTIVETADDDDDFKILTKSGRTISQNEVYIRSKVLMERNGKSVVRSSAWTELVNFYEGLKAHGSLEK